MEYLFAADARGAYANRASNTKRPPKTVGPARRAGRKGMPMRPPRRAVPGGVHSALLKAKLIEDSFWGRNETNNLWVGKSCWIVSRTFEANAALLAKREIVLRLEGCDTFAKVILNGTVVVNTTDRFQRYTFDVKPCEIHCRAF